MEKEHRTPALWMSIALFVFTAVMIISTVRIWEQDLHLTLIICSMVAAAVGILYLKFSYAEIEKGMIDGIYTALQAMLILYTVGPLVGSWIASGVVPSMIYYGLNILNPTIFLFATLLICSIVAIATGTSWGTTGTVGIALMGIAVGLGIPAPMTAGIIISGAYFGDKMSPLSDTTNLAPAVAGTDLFQHIRAMCWTSAPTYCIVGVITLILGFKYAGGSLDTAKINAMQQILSAEFWISPITFIAPVVVIVLSAMRKPALPSLGAGIGVAVVIGLCLGVGNFGEMLGIMQYGYVPKLSADIANAADPAKLTALLASNHLALDPKVATAAANDIVKLMERGGLQSMNWTISLIICAFIFGSIMDTCGFLKVLLAAIMKPIKSVGGMITVTLISCILSDIFLGDQFMAIAIPGRMFKPAFDAKGLHPRMLSRTLEDAGTLFSAMVPWSTCGAYQTKILGVPTLEYAPYAFLNYLNPIVASVMTFMGIGIFWRGKNGEPVHGGKTRPAELA